MVVRRWRAGCQEGPQPLDITLEHTTGSSLIGNSVGFPVGRRGPENLLVQLAWGGGGQCRCPIWFQGLPASPGSGQRAHGVGRGGGSQGSTAGTAVGQQRVCSRFGAGAGLPVLTRSPQMQPRVPGSG